MVSVVDPIEFVRKNVKLFFRSGVFDPDELVAHLVAEALRGRATSVRILRFTDWWIVAGDTDWLGSDAERSFRMVVSYPEGGVNSMRAELLVTAFADAAGTGGSRDWQNVVGQCPSEIIALASDLASEGRAVAFRVVT